MYICGIYDWVCIHIYIYMRQRYERPRSPRLSDCKRAKFGSSESTSRAAVKDRQARALDFKICGNFPR